MPTLLSVPLAARTRKPPAEEMIPARAARGRLHSRLRMDAQPILEYHARSKHQLERYAPGPGYMDWATQPDPFRTYAGAPRVELPLVADELAVRFNDLRRGALPGPAPLDRDAIALLLELSLAISAWKSYRGTSWALRCNPSSGNLHPTEGYVVCARVPGLEAGVYHYVSREHALERRARLADASAPVGGVLVGLASIYWREAWKYGIRAFRYCNHDCGHAIAAVAYAVAALGWRTRYLAEAGDADVARLLGLDRDADFAQAEREQPDCLLWVGAGEPPSLDAISGLVAGATWAGAANQLSASHRDWPDIDHAHAAAVKPRPPLAARRSQSSSPWAQADGKTTVAAFARQRRRCGRGHKSTSIKCARVSHRPQPGQDKSHSNRRWLNRSVEVQSAHNLPKPLPCPAAICYSWCRRTSGLACWPPVGWPKCLVE